MKLTDRYDGSESPFEGDRTLILRSLPVNARVLKAVVRLMPVSGPTGELFEEIISFSNAQGSFGGSKITGIDFVEVDFHKRRTLARVTGTKDGPATNANLQVDLGGGVYVEINDKGAIRAPGDELFPVPLDGKLPGLVVTKFKLTGSDGSDVDISRVIIRSVPTNVSVRLGNLGPFWTHLGELTTDNASPDFAPILQAFLLDASAENGFYSIPLILHSDTIARLQVVLDIEYQVEASVMPEGLNEVKLPFDFGSLPKARENVLQVDVPANMRVAPGGVTAHVRGAFEESRIAYGPTGVVTPEGAAEISPASAQAQMIFLPQTIKATAFDLLMEIEQTAKLQVDLREDLDGKPGGISLLPGTVKLELPAPTRTLQTTQTTGQSQRVAQWVSIALNAEFEFQEDQRYWLVLQSLEGQAAWSAAAALAGSAGMQHTRDGGLSWRNTVATGISGSASAFFRLRHKPERFEMPIELQVGSGEQAVRVSLDRFQPLGRVDFALDIDEVGDTFNQYLDTVAPTACPEIEHLVNGDFEQWRSVGEKPGKPTQVALLPQPSNPTVMAISPDGQWAYVALDALQIIDTVCNKALTQLSVYLPKALIFHPAGGRAYLLDSSGLQVINTDTHNTVGSLKEPLNALAISPDGSVLYVTERANKNGNWAIRAIDTMKLEQAVLTDNPQPDAVTIGHWVDLGDDNNPTALAVSPNGRHLYVTISKGEGSGLVQVFDATVLQPLRSPFDVGKNPRAIALTADGEWAAVIADEGEKAVSIIDTKTLTVQFVKLEQTPIAIAIAPDGKKAYVADGGDNGGISIIDIAKRSAVGKKIDSVASQTAMTLAPQGDRLYVIGKGSTTDLSISLYFIEIGVHVPIEWDLPAGSVAPLCLPDPFGLTAVLGMPPLTDAKTRSRPIPSALSQTVPVAPSCSYEFSFYGIALDIDALAEVLWIGKDCRPLRTDQVPIQAFERQTKNNAQVWNQSGSSAALKQLLERFPLQLHRERLVAPASAEQAEVRFSTPAGVAAVIDMVSLKATAEVVLNGDLKAQQDGQVAGWNLLVPAVYGVTVVIVEDGIELRNASDKVAELVQTILVRGEQLFNLEFQGRATVRPTVKENPRVALHWLKADRSVAGSPTILQILPTGSDSVLASVTSPAGAAEAELRLVVPAKTTLEIKRVSLRFPAVTSIPVTFIAQAPGELTVSNWKVAFEQKEAEAPRIPEKGLCPPTPLGQEPGETYNNCCYCPCCEAERAIVDSKQIMTPAGRPALAGRCADCGAELIRSGGSRGTLPVWEDRPKVQPLIISPRRAKTVVTHMARAELPLTAVRDIGDARAKKLKEHGIDTMSKLAATDPQKLVELLWGVELELAQRIVKETQQLSRQSSEAGSSEF